MKRLQNGITLVELLICILIVSMSYTFTTYGISKWINRARLTSTLNNLVTAIQHAKLSAIMEEQTVIVCPSNLGDECDRKHWGDNIIVFVDSNNNEAIDADEEILRYVDRPHKNIQINGTRDFIRFHPGGLVATPISLKLCIFHAIKPLSRGLTVSLQGRLRNSKDIDKDGLHELFGAEEINCN